MRDWRHWILSGKRLSRTAYFVSQPGALAELTDLRDELQAKPGIWKRSISRKRHWRSRLRRCVRKEQTALNCNSNCERIRALHRCWRWMWTPAPSLRWWRTGPASRSSLLRDEQSDLLSMEQSLENRVVGNARRSAPSHSGCGRLKPASRRRTAHRGIPADRPQRHRQNRKSCTHTGRHPVWW